MERSLQVPLMTRIYQTARRTLMWIGEENGPDTAEAFDMLLILAEIWRAKGADEDDMEFISNAEDLAGSARMNLKNKSLWHSLYDVLARTYFRRMWILQEIVVSPEAVIICGAQEIDWTLFQEAAHLVAVCSFTPISISNYIYRIRSAQLRYLERNGGLQHLVYLFQGFNATDPRDYIYALLGIAGFNKRDAEFFKAGPIRVDYNKSVQTVFREAATHILCDYGDTDLLRLVLPNQLQELEGMPTWVPEFSNYSSPCSIDTYNKPLGDLLHKHVQNTVSSNVLSFQGLFVDVISFCTIEFSEDNTDTILKNIYATAQRESAAYRTGESHTEALWRTLVANMTGDSRRTAPPGYGAAFDTWISRIILTDIGLSMEVIIENPKIQVLQQEFPTLKDMFPRQFEADLDVRSLIGSSPFLYKKYIAATRKDEAYQVVARDRLYFRTRDGPLGQDLEDPEAV